ncbi:MAG: three-Cys-motif partner protein TcmP [Caldisericia bacterium]
MINNEWDITNKPHTKNKLEIIRAVFDMWLTVWNGDKQQEWVNKEWYVMDLFAGAGIYFDSERQVRGSSLILLQNIFEQKDKLEKNGIKIKLFLVEIKKQNFDNLNKNVNAFFNSHEKIKNIVDVHFYQGDCNTKITDILKEINNSRKNPLFVLIDPYGLQIKKKTIKEIAKLDNPKDILLNYILEGVRRVGGVYKKGQKKGKVLNKKELKTVKTFEEFMGEDVKMIGETDKKTLEQYVSTLAEKGLNIVGYDMPYADRNDILYYLLFASKKAKITKIVKDIYYRQKKKQDSQTTLFGEEYEKSNIFSVNSKSKVIPIRRKSLLYKTKVEYGDWTINHIIGCMHGCNFPCYAMMMAKKFGWVKSYEDWRKPRIAVNALELLEKEISKYKDGIKHFVHLCFMSDPFMYDSEKKDLIPEIKEMTLKIIERLNKEGIRVATLTKGLYPEEILDKKRFSQDNEYGITLVSLNENFKKEYEPFSAPYEERIESLKRLAKPGLKTWVSMEPYPTPQLPRLKKTGAEKIDEILERIKFVKKIVFGKLNYSRLNYYNGNYSQIWNGNSDDFYKEMVQKVIYFCQKNSIEYHIKFGTPLSRKNTKNIFK